MEVKKESEDSELFPKRLEENEFLKIGDDKTKPTIPLEGAMQVLEPLKLLEESSVEPIRFSEDNHGQDKQENS